MRTAYAHEFDAFQGPAAETGQPGALGRGSLERLAEFSRDEVATHFVRWRQAVDRHDLDGMASMLGEDAQGGNSQYGLFRGREAISQFSRDRWPESVPNRSVWHAIDGHRVVDKWRETLPGGPPPDHDYHYYGITELIYSGSGEWSFMYGIPDVVGLMRVYGRWRRDGQAALHGEVYPDIPSS